MQSIQDPASYKTPSALNVLSELESTHAPGKTLKKRVSFKVSLEARSGKIVRMKTAEEQMRSYGFTMQETNDMKE